MKRKLAQIAFTTLKDMTKNIMVSVKSSFMEKEEALAVIIGVELSRIRGVKRTTAAQDRNITHRMNNVQQTNCQPKKSMQELKMRTVIRTCFIQGQLSY